jgi:aminopeptidase YwaD
MPTTTSKGTKSLALIFLLLFANGPLTPAQRPKSPDAILESNIRAELGFLASDAMQGRGSGTNYERVAAEYIGSMFRQFGLEPGGDADGTGAKSFVQTVNLATQRFSGPPTLTISAGDQSKSWQFGRDFLASSVRSAKSTGNLKLVEIDGMPTKGAFVVLKSVDADQQKRQEFLRKARAASAAGVIMIETDETKKTRESGSPRLPSLGARFTGEVRSENTFVTINLSVAAFNQIVSIPEGAKVEFGGPTETSQGSSTWNAVGFLRGSGPRANEAIMLSAHLDHLGVNESATGDKIFNGADDDASGCVAVLELARALAAGRRPRRTVYFVCFGSEERGGYGARYFVDHSPVPLDHIVADITFEMLGRPDAKVPANTLWLTGFERSNLGSALARRGALLVADPHPEENFFQRSDNYTLALRGVVAHTVSSFGLHSDYHRPSDELSKIDFPFMTRSIKSLILPIRWLANSTFKPSWLPGKAPVRN